VFFSVTYFVTALYTNTMRMTNSEPLKIKISRELPGGGGRGEVPSNPPSCSCLWCLVNFLFPVYSMKNAHLNAPVRSAKRYYVADNYLLISECFGNFRYCKKLNALYSGCQISELRLVFSI